jgi:hypothetical protein
LRPFRRPMVVCPSVAAFPGLDISAARFVPVAFFRPGRPGTRLVKLLRIDEAGQDVVFWCRGFAPKV